MDIEGPGLWYAHEILAKKYNDNPEMFEELFVAISREMICGNCARWALLYVEKNYPDNPSDWIYKCHDAVNKKLERVKYEGEKIILEDDKMAILGPGLWRAHIALSKKYYNNPELFKELFITINKEMNYSDWSLSYIEKNYPDNPVEWVCKCHNRVNMNLRKPTYKCPKFPLTHLY